ncbi:MAG: hypothetical protein IJI60_01860 [Bacilli bacterium]|nr:hypothetical protein [Bacilli bacterium]
MEEALKKLIEKYYDRFLTRGFIQEAFDILISYYKDLEDYISDFQLIFYYEDNLGRYDLQTRVLSVNVGNLCETIIEPSIKNRKLLSLEVLRHELEHVKQIKTLWEGEESLEKYLLTCAFQFYCLRENISKNNKDSQYIKNLAFLKKDNYDLDPSERLAEIRAFEFVLPLLDKARDRNDLETLKKALWKQYCKGYFMRDQFLPSPTYEFLLNIGLCKECEVLQEMVEKYHYYPHTRFVYGLPMEPEEVEKEKAFVLRKF